MSDTDAFVDALGAELAADVPDEVRTAMFTNDALAAEVLGLVQEAKEGLRNCSRAYGTGLTPEALEVRLRQRKTRILALLPSSVYTVEKILARAIERIVARARELGG